MSTTGIQVEEHMLPSNDEPAVGSLSAWANAPKPKRRYKRATKQQWEIAVQEAYRRGRGHAFLAIYGAALVAGTVGYLVGHFAR